MSVASVEAVTLAPPLRKPNTLFSGKLAINMLTLQETVAADPFSFTIRSVRVPSTWKPATFFPSRSLRVGTLPPGHVSARSLPFTPKVFSMVFFMRARSLSLLAASVVFDDIGPMST